MNSELKTLKFDLGTLHKELENARSKTAGIRHTRADLESKLSDISRQLSEAREVLESVAIQVSKGALKERELERASNDVTSLEGRERGLADVLRKSEDNIAEAVECESEIGGRVSTKQREIWRLVEYTELAKAAIMLRRALVAHGKARSTSMGNLRLVVRDFIKLQVFEATFTGEQVAFEEIAERLNQEYFGV